MAPSNSLQISATDDSMHGTPLGPSSRHYNSTNRNHQNASNSITGGYSSHNLSHFPHDPRPPYKDPSNLSIPPTPSSQPYADVYSHPAAVAYAAAHPRRTIPKFGPYILVQNLHGKVKLGLYSQWGEEVAVKRIRRGNVDSSLRMSKVEREIEVLKTLKHPNIVRLYDVIETDKHIGIILEYASGGELFDHILAHRYLREKNALKLFSQLISGIWYLHQRKIVHRTLSLHNILLDRNRNIVIAGFGFTNSFKHRDRVDDLMQTICGSPCYAAPELVVSEGLYVGSAVDIWSCGVVLYAMLAGYFPFDDYPANPNRDSINLLYKYIVSTPLSFPKYISTEARDFLSTMLVPDPQRRTTLGGVMRHPWLTAYRGDERRDGVPNAFGRSVDELERTAMEQHQQKRLAYQRQITAFAQPQQAPSQRQRQQVQNIAQVVTPFLSQPHEPDHIISQPLQVVQSHSTQPEYLHHMFKDEEEIDQDTLSVKTSLYSLASSRTASTDYGIYCRRLALSQESFTVPDE